MFLWLHLLFSGWLDVYSGPVKARGNEEEMWQCRARVKTTFDKCVCVFDSLLSTSALYYWLESEWRCTALRRLVSVPIIPRVCARDQYRSSGWHFQSYVSYPDGPTPRRRTPPTHTLPREHNYNYQLTHHNYSRGRERGREMKADRTIDNRKN